MIGVFDSGVGGLMVARELLRRLTGYDIVYFGDTARTPYGTKSPETITRYATQAADFLLSQGAKAIIIACHTASAVAAGALRQSISVPVWDVVAPALTEAKRVTKNGRIGVIGTTATIGSGVYQERLAAKKVQVFTQPCPLFVPLVEEDWTRRPETKRIASAYLRPLKLKQIDTLVLACTHYPLLREVIHQKIGARVRLVDPAMAVAREVQSALEKDATLKSSLSTHNQLKIFCSDVTDATQKLTERWLGRRVEIHRHVME